MTKAEQTPRPFHYGEAKNGRKYIFANDGLPAARVDSKRSDKDELGLMFAAAPELLEALELCSFEMGYANWGKPEAITARQDCLAKARAAIAKAKGA